MCSTIVSDNKKAEKNRNNSEEFLYRDKTLSTDERVENLLQLMDVNEKIGQMTQLDITLINTTGEQKDVILDSEKARELIKKHHIGSFLNGEAAEPEEWRKFITDLMKISVEETRFGIPVIYGIDHIHGASYLEGSTIFPHGINLGATFDPEHAHNAGRITAEEAAPLGHHWSFSPVLDIGVNPLWPRMYETYGEDPYLAGEMGRAYVQGLQDNAQTGPHKMAATGKHFLGYSDPKSGWDRTPVHLSMQQIHEFHRPSFQKAIDAGLKTIMLNSGEINGVPVHASKQLLTELLRNQMGFDGVVVTDWDDIGKLVDFHYTAKNFKEATYDSVMAGIDMCMTPLHLKFNTSLLELVKEGRISEDRIDQSVRRILRLKFELGLFENPYPSDKNDTTKNKRRNRKLALDAARDSIVLLKNEKALLPLKKHTKIGVFGISANSKRNLSGGWTLSWQGGKEEQYPTDIHTIYSALEKEFPDSEVRLFDDIPESGSLRDIQKYASEHKLHELDYIIYAGGEEPYTEFAGNINDLELPKNQVSDVKLLSQFNIPIVLVLVEGRPRLINEIIDDVDAIIFAGLPGFEGGEALANIMSGKCNPSGKMPVSYSMYPNHYLPYNHKRSNLYFVDPEVANQIVQNDQNFSPFPFGYGLSYTSFAYSNFKLSTSKITPDESITAEVTVTNTGKREGAEAVLWYTSTHFGKITRPVKELKHFERITLNPGESKKVKCTITPEMLSYPDENGRRILEHGMFSLIVGSESRDFEIYAKQIGGLSSSKPS